MQCCDWEDKEVNPVFTLSAFAASKHHCTPADLGCVCTWAMFISIRVYVQHVRCERGHKQASWSELLIKTVFELLFCKMFHLLRANKSLRKSQMLLQGVQPCGWTPPPLELQLGAVFKCSLVEAREPVILLLRVACQFTVDLQSRRMSDPGIRLYLKKQLHNFQGHYNSQGTRQ